MSIDINILTEVRKSPRKMHKSYLQKLGIMEKIDDLVPEDFKIKEKIDIIIEGEYNKCYCGKHAKFGTKWCSITCMNKDSGMRYNTSIKNTLNSKDRLSKAKKTRELRYGVSSVQDIPISKEKTKITKQKYYDSVISDTFNRYGLDQDKLSDHEYLNSICKDSCVFDVMRDHFNNMPYTTLLNHFSRICFDPNFKRGSSSFGEQEMFLWLKSIIDCDIVSNNRKTIGKELDILIPEKNIAIEFNGIYWHSEKVFKFKGIDAKKYHKNKMDLCKEKGIQLLQFFEDEWLFKKDIVKSIISSKLGLYNKRYFARKLTIKPVGKNDSDMFLNNNHLQGACAGSNVGLYDGDDIICIMTYGKSRFEDDYELIRFASKLNTQVVGGLSKLISYVKNKLGVKTIITYADLRYSDGSSYNKLGEYVKTTDVGYNWVGKNGTLRLNRFKTQKHKLKMLLGDDIDLNKTEDQLMSEHGFLKLYDCGNLKYRV